MIIREWTPTFLSPEMAFIGETPLFILGMSLHNILVKDVISNPTYHTNRKSELNTEKPKQKNLHFSWWMFTSCCIMFSFWLSSPFSNTDISCYPFLFFVHFNQNFGWRAIKCVSINHNRDPDTCRIFFSFKKEIQLTLCSVHFPCHYIFLKAWFLMPL